MKTMKRTNFYFPQQLITRLYEESRDTGYSMSEILRKALEEYLGRRK